MFLKDFHNYKLMAVNALSTRYTSHNMVQTERKKPYFEAREGSEVHTAYDIFF